MTLTPQQIEQCLEVLRIIDADVTLIDEHHELKKRIADIHRKGRKLARQRSQTQSDTTEPASEPVVRPEEVEEATPQTPPRFKCYICKEPLKEQRETTGVLCPACADINLQKRTQQTNLSGYTALVTGGRIRIGYQVALKLLRWGATVVVTTRFPCDAAVRFAREEDFSTWSERLQIHGLDLRDLAAVDRFIAALNVEHSSLEIVINNAAQTVRRPPAYYAHLLNRERAAGQDLPKPVAAVLAGHTYHVSPGQRSLRTDPPSSLSLSSEREPLALTQPAPIPWSAAELSQLPLLPEDESNTQQWFPTGRLDEAGEQVDLRPYNSWLATIDEVANVELAEVMCVNVMAPFQLLRGLLPLLKRSRVPRRFVVNVAAREGQFNGFWTNPAHPHTNMGKAALNMLTRTLGTSWAHLDVFVTSVDPGWVSEQRPLTDDDQVRPDGYPIPLNAEDGAARILDPIYLGLSHDERPYYGVLLKDFRPIAW